MPGIGCCDCAVAVSQTRTVTGYLGQAEIRALGVLADAGLVPPLQLTVAGTGARTWVSAAFPEAKAS